MTTNVEQDCDVHKTRPWTFLERTHRPCLYVPIHRWLLTEYLFLSPDAMSDVIENVVVPVLEQVLVDQASLEH